MSMSNEWADSRTTDVYRLTFGRRDNICEWWKVQGTNTTKEMCNSHVLSKIEVLKYVQELVLELMFAYNKCSKL